MARGWYRHRKLIDDCNQIVITSKFRHNVISQSKVLTLDGQASELTDIEVENLKQYCQRYVDKEV